MCVKASCLGAVDLSWLSKKHKKAISCDGFFIGDLVTNLCHLCTDNVVLIGR